jgi:hypothetical protein
MFIAGFIAGNLEFTKGAYHWERAYSVFFLRPLARRRRSPSFEVSTASTVTLQSQNKILSLLNKIHKSKESCPSISSLILVTLHAIPVFNLNLLLRQRPERTKDQGRVSRSNYQIGKRARTQRIGEHMYKEYDQSVAVGY